LCQLSPHAPVKIGYGNSLLEHDPGVVVLAANLHVDSNHSAKFAHCEIDVFGPIEFRYTKDFQFQFLVQDPVPPSVAYKRPVYDMLGIRSLSRAAGSQSR